MYFYFFPNRNVGNVGSVEQRRHHGGTLIIPCVTSVTKTNTRQIDAHCVTQSKVITEWYSVTRVAGEFLQKPNK